MFKPVRLLSNNTALQAAWQKLVRMIQCRIEAALLENDSGGAMLRGHIVYASGNRTVDLAVNSGTPAEADWCAIVAEPTPDGEIGVMQTDNLAYVLLIPEINPAVRDIVYVSDVAGYGTNVEPGGGAVAARVGQIYDVSPYATEGAVWCLINTQCCDPEEILQ